MAVAQNIQTVMVARFFQGLFGSSAQSIAGGALADMWDAQERGFAVPLFAGSLFGGPIFGPIVRILSSKPLQSQKLTGVSSSWAPSSRRVALDGAGKILRFGE